MLLTPETQLGPSGEADHRQTPLPRSPLSRDVDHPHSRLKLLIVEDDRVQARLVRGALEVRADKPPQVWWAKNLAAAIELLRDELPDVVLLDLNLPDSQGLTTYRRIARASPNTPVVVLTGESDMSVATEAVSEGAQDFLVKDSVDGRTIYRAALYAVERHRRLRAERHMLTIQEEERKRVARELHDGVIQSLVALRLRLQMLGDATGDDPRAAQLLQLADEAKDAADEVHAICRDLHPCVLDSRPLPEAVRWYLGKMFSGSGVEWVAELDSYERLSPTAKQQLFRILQEAARNVARHSRARWVRVTLRVEKTETVLSVRDDGRGFTVCAQAADGGLGLVSMRERAELLGGSLSIESHGGCGTLVEARVPNHPNCR